MRANEDVRRAIGAAGVKQWEVAEALGILECNFSRKLRKELPREEKKVIIEVIEQLKREENV